MSWHQLNSKTKDLVLLEVLKLSPVVADGMDGNGLKLEKNGQFFRVLMLRVPKVLENLLWLALSGKIHVISSS